VFAVVGEALVDLVQAEPGGPYTARPGGGPLNIAVGLRRLGHPTALMARFSTGALGGLVRRHALECGLDLSGSVTTELPATLALASVDGGGSAAYEFYVEGTADWAWTAAELAALPSDATVVHTGSLAGFVEPGAARLLDWWEGLRAQGERLLSYDPNVRAGLVGDRSAAVTQVERFVAAANVVKASDEDLRLLYPSADPLEVLTGWSQQGPRLVVLTRGSEGCLAVQPGRSPVAVPGVAVPVVDTIGAGDAFCAGLLSALADAEATTPASLASLAPSAVVTALQRAVTVSALTCTRAGADPPSRSELGLARPN
jgi:fructokinase